MNIKTFWSLVFTLYTANAFAIELEHNLLKNPGFEQGQTSWYIEDGTTIEITHKRHSGAKAICYTQGGIGQSTGTLSDINGNKRYILSGFYKNEGTVDGMWMGVVFSDADWKELGGSEIALTNSYQYAPFAMVFTPPAGTVHMTYWTWSEAPGGGKTYLDDIALYVENVTPNNQAPTLDPIEDQQNTVGENVSLQLHASDNDNDPIIYAINGLTEESGIYLNPTSGHLSGTASPSGNYALQVFAIDNKGGIATRNFTWSINAEPITACNILQNAGFENSIFGWDTYGEEIERTDDSHSGNFALAVKNGGLDQFSKEITTGPDTYQFNGFYKFDGNINGAWVGIIFYDNKHKALATQTVALDPSSDYQKFVVNATSDNKVRYIQAWIWVEGDGKVLLDDLKLSTSACYDYVIPSSLPPKGISVNNAPQFVVIGFDDNTKAEGIDWAIDLFQNKKNPDGSDARVSFYINTRGLYEWIEDQPTRLKAAMQRLSQSGHEIGNHTYGHHSDIDSNNWDNFIRTVLGLDQARWSQKINNATRDLTNQVGLAPNTVYGFRAPYLLYNQAMFEALSANGFVYDCSIEEGYAANFDGTNFRWPYQLDRGSPGHNESWFGNPNNPSSVTITSIPGLWELPNHVFMVPKDSECAEYGIQPGLWQRIKQKIPYLDGYKITGFDYNLWSKAELTKADVLGILKYNLDLRLKGNRAPMMFGAHTQYYTNEWADNYAPNASATQMREAISEFIDYALSKPEVRIRPGIDIIRWCANPIPLQ